MINYTITGKSDGFGAQYQAFMSGIAYCRFKNYNYVHTPFKNIEHSQDPTRLNQFIGIPKSNNNKKIQITEEFSHIVHYCKNPSVFYTPEVISLLKKFYFSSKKPEIKEVDIAIHIRRGDVNNYDPSVKGRFTSNLYYVKLRKYLKHEYPNRKITIFSQGKPDDFNDLKEDNVSFQLDIDLQKTFHSLVTSKILVMSKSSFSYTAAILNPNLIYYIDFWHRPLNNWIIL